MRMDSNNDKAPIIIYIYDESHSFFDLLQFPSEVTSNHDPYAMSFFINTRIE